MSNRKKAPQKKSKLPEEDSKSSTGREIASYIIIIVVGILLAQHLNVVVSGSMEPVFYRGDVVLIEKSNFLGIEEVSPNNLQVGDIIIYQATWYPEPVIHRIISTGKDAQGRSYYVTQGDNNSGADPAPVDPDQVQAKVISWGEYPLIIPKIGYLTLWIRGL